MQKSQHRLLALILFCSSLPAAAATADFYKCTNREGGDWSYGRVPYVCTANVFGDDSVLKNDYPQLIFADAASRTTERNRYIQEMDAVIRNSAIYYLRGRKPAATATEIAQWQLLVSLTAAHESKMSHYRKTTDTRFKMMRGDYGHGHGMMQIDDRSHFDSISKGIAWNLITNVSYGMDVLFEQWQRAPSQSCVGGASNWKSRILATWAAYNGGPGSICRWTNSKSVYAAHDAAFLDMYNQQTWRQYVAQAQRASSIDIECMMENHKGCAAPGENTAPKLREGVLYRLPDLSVCTLKAGQLQCVASSQDQICLNAFGAIDNAGALVVDAAAINGVKKVTNDRHALCRTYDATLLAVGTSIKAVTAINLRATAGGGLLGTVAQGAVAEILDFELRNAPDNDRYYKIKAGTQTGFIYAGDVRTQSDWVVKSTPVPTIPTTVAKAGQMISVRTASGINMRSTIGGAVQLSIPTQTSLKVLAYVIQGDNNQLYYKVSYGGKTGYIYSGSMKPVDTTAQWTKKI